MTTRRIAYLALLILMISPSAGAQEANEILKKAKAKVDLVKDYQADGIMKLNVTFLQVPDSKVMVYYKQPDKFRIRQRFKG